jgi:hypothetical protein
MDWMKVVRYFAVMRKLFIWEARMRQLARQILTGFGVVTVICILAGAVHLITPDEVTFWTAATALFTGAVGFVAWYQIGEIKRQQRGWETLRICNVYDVDPVLDRAVCTIRSAVKQGKSRIEVKLEITTLLNYFESIALGISQGFYEEKIVRIHLGDIMKAHADFYLSEPLISQLNFSSNFISIKRLIARWYPNANPSSGR